ncbi:MAG: hypothetical protein IJ315_06175, partial [Firmicutes bacterium]|nr:hypothetical protein [Bacillota bacterium]
MEKPLIIFDTDMDTDCDDAGALAIIYEYVRRGKAELLGIITDSVSPWAAPCCDTLGQFYGIQRPIGAVSSSAYPESETLRCVKYRTHTQSLGVRRYNEKLSAGKTDADYPSAVQVYRRLLVTAEDHSVTIVCVGVLSALHQLSLSLPDEVCPLSGTDLLAQKVDKVICMAYPDKHGPNFNWEMDGIGAKEFLEKCPVPVYVSGEGQKVITGSSLTSVLSPDHPLRYIYETWNLGPHRGRSSWDLIAVLQAMQPDNKQQHLEPLGTVYVNAEEKYMRWDPEGARKDH